MNKLNIGCGAKPLKGYVNLDQHRYEGVDIVWNLEDSYLPFTDNSFHEINADNILEHIDYQRLMLELVRIMKPGGVLRIRVPHYTCRDSYADPTHKHLFSNKTFSFFVKNKWPQNKEYNYQVFSKIRTYIVFEHRLSLIWNFILEPLINISNASREYYERSFLSMFPASAIMVELTK